MDIRRCDLGHSITFAKKICFRPLELDITTSVFLVGRHNKPGMIRPLDNNYTLRHHCVPRHIDFVNLFVRPNKSLNALFVIPIDLEILS